MIKLAKIFTATYKDHYNNNINSDKLAIITEQKTICFDLPKDN